MNPIGSSERWRDQSVARLCQIIVDSNDGIIQQMMENRHDLMDIMSLEELQNYNDVGLSVAYLAIHYDQPDLIRYLHRRGIDMSKPCDPMEFGTPMFYAVSSGKIEAVKTLNSLGYSVNSPCDTVFGLLPEKYAIRRDDVLLQKLIEDIKQKELRIKSLFHKNILRFYYRKLFIKKRKCAIRIQTRIRIKICRNIAKLIRRGELIWEGSIAEGTDSVSINSAGDDVSVQSSVQGSISKGENDSQSQVSYRSSKGNSRQS